MIVLRSLQRPPLAYGVLVASLTVSSASAQWTYGPQAPTSGVGRAHCALVENGAGMYLLGGLPATSGGDAPAHALVQGAWFEVQPVEGLFLEGGFAVDELDRILVIAGADATGDPGDHYRWNATDGGAGGIAERDDPSPPTGFAVASDDLGRVVCIGGAADVGATPALFPGAVDRYDATLDTWTSLAPLPTPVNDAAACNDGTGHLRVFGGYDAAGVRTTNVASYDLATGAWSDSAIDDLPVALAGAEAVLGNDGLVYVIGGSDATGPVATVHVLDPVLGIWGAGPTLNDPREHFGCHVDSDGFIWAVGGTTTATSEKLFTSTCPSIVTVDTPEAFVGTSASIHVVVGGSPPFTFRWTADGASIADGPTGFGGEFVGSDSPALAIHGVTAADAGRVYRCEIENACGSAVTSPVVVPLREAPALPQQMVCASIHPPGAVASAANSVDAGAVAGSTSYSHPQWSTLSRPVLWTAPGSAPPIDLTPPNSVGGSCTHLRDGAVVGWWWWPYTVAGVGTGYNRHASLWHVDGTHFEMQRSGWEFGSISATDGTSHAGYARADESSTNTIGVRFTGTSRGGVGLTPIGAWGSSATAVDAGVVFGHVHLGFGVVHPAMWDDGANTFVDLVPSGGHRGYVHGASDGLQVGTVDFGSGLEPCLWSSSAASCMRLEVAGESVTVSTTRHGVLLGQRSANGTLRAAMFREGVGQWFDLSASLPSGYRSAVAHDLDFSVASNTWTVVGAAYNETVGRTEAVMWVGLASGGPSTIGPGGRSPVTNLRRRP